MRWGRFGWRYKERSVTDGFDSFIKVPYYTSAGSERAPDAYLDPNRTSRMEHFCGIVNS